MLLNFDCHHVLFERDVIVILNLFEIELLIQYVRIAWSVSFSREDLLH